jgi:hypothetical protein
MDQAFAFRSATPSDPFLPTGIWNTRPSRHRPLAFDIGTSAGSPQAPPPKQAITLFATDHTIIPYTKQERYLTRVYSLLPRWSSSSESQSLLLSSKSHHARSIPSTDWYMSRRSKPKSRLQQLREQIVKMGGEDVAQRFETLQLHAGESLQVSC